MGDYAFSCMQNFVAGPNEVMLHREVDYENWKCTEVVEDG
jgi:hypothetical protein